MATENKANKKKVFDVTKPGETEAGATSRPLILGHRTMLKQDPMVAVSNLTSEVADKDQDTDEPPKEKIIRITSAPPVPKEKVEDKEVVSVRQPKIEPPAAPSASKIDGKLIVSTPVSEEKPKEEEATKTSNAEPKPLEEVKEESNDEEKTTDETTETTEDTSLGSDQALVGAVSNQTVTKKQADKAAEEETARQAALEKIIAQKKYYVPIGEKKRQRSAAKAIIIVVLVLVLALALGDLLIDSGVIKTSIKPPIRIFNAH